VQKVWKALLFFTCVLKKRNTSRNAKSLAYTSKRIPIRDYESACCNPCTERLINALDRVHMKAARFKNHMKDSECGNLAQRRTIARLCAHFKAYSGERSWKAIYDRLRMTYYLSRVDHVRKIMYRKQRTDMAKYSFVNRTIKNWNQIPAETLGLSLVSRRFLERELGKQL